MCGMTGLAFANSETLAAIQKMTDTLLHRGPDASDIWTDDSSGVAFGHRRLAIIDLSENGRQPMTSISGRYVMVLNGEIYNFQEIRQALISQYNCKFRGHSDTEVLLVAIEMWGIEKALKSAVGMFAFALWDKEMRTLYLARDRFGEKPLYYGFLKEGFAFASELKAFKAIPAWQGKIDRQALQYYLRYGYIPSPLCIYQGLSKLKAGTYLTLSPDKQIKLSVYWSATAVAETAAKSPLPLNFKESIDLLEKQLQATIKLQGFADVPVGAFLSGGIDSSLVTALLQSQANRPIHTFSIGFQEARFNEAEHAKAVAQHLKTEHTELYVTPQDCKNVIPLLANMYDEPFADASQIPTYLLAKLAKTKVTVALSGDGGDELFGGYDKYFNIQAAWQKISLMPYPLRRYFAKLLPNLSAATWNKVYLASQGKLPGAAKIIDFGYKLSKAANILAHAKTQQDYYQAIISSVDRPDRWIRGAEVSTTGWPMDFTFANHDFQSWMMLCDTLTYLSDDILVKVDRAAMAVSLETRAPLLDHRLYELAWRLPKSYKIHGRQSKYILRELLYRYVPKHLIDRPKMGFSVPIAEWLRGPLLPWAEALLSKNNLDKHGYWNSSIIKDYWQAHKIGLRNHSQVLWNVLMFEAWFAEQ